MCRFAAKGFAMGSWAVDSFANDDAADWLAELEDQRDLALVELTLDVALTLGEEYLEVAEAARGLVAAEVIASARGHAGLNASAEPQLARWIATVRPAPDAGLVGRAVELVDRVLDDGSELRELWEEAGEADAWRSDVQDLRRRLLAGPPGKRVMAQG